MTELIPEKAQPSVPIAPEILVPRLGDYLVEKNLISTQNLGYALASQKEHRNQGRNVLLGELLVELGLIDRPTLDMVVTEQILQLRAALEQTNAQLEHRVQERTQELQDALQKLSELSQLKSNFIANISHELRTPLTHIKGYVELLLSGTMGALDESQASALLVVQRATGRLEQQIEDLIHFSLASRGEFTLHLAMVNVVNLISTVVSRSADKAQEKEIVLKTELPDDLPGAEGDGEKLLWACIQLVDNAVKFTPSHGVVQLSARLDKNRIEVAVSDTGIGIPMERFDEIFEPFHQLDGSATRRYGGTGLGLALVKQILEAHGTTIQLESQVGQGTKFFFSLPVLER